MPAKVQFTTVEKAREYILERVPSPGFYTDTVRVEQSVGHIASTDLYSPVPVPAYTNAAMDGYAFAAGEIDWKAASVTLPIAGVSLAGHPFRGDRPAGSAVRITTGAKVPSGCDTVIQYEKTVFSDTEITFAPSSVRPRGNVRLEGESVRIGERVLERGTEITAGLAALLASLGLGEIEVHRRPVIGFFATGDELIEPGMPLPPHGIYNSNSSALAAMLTRMNVEWIDFGTARDTPDSIREVLEEAFRRCDMVLVSGGASGGSADSSRELVETEADMAPWLVKMRPGKPMRFALWGEQRRPLFVLPGNPVAAVVAFLEFARGAIRKMQGRKDGFWPVEFNAVAACDIKKRDGRYEFQRGNITVADDGRVMVTPLMDQSSSALTTVAGANAIIALPLEGSLFPKGSVVRVQPFACFAG